MIGKNNHYLRDTKDGTKVETYSIKKFKVGTASVVIGASIFFGAGAVAQASEEVSNNTTADNTTNAGAKENVPTAPVATAQPVAKETSKEDVASAVAAKLGGETAKEVKALDKSKLEKYVAEIEAKFADGTYANKTEESVAVLKADLEAAKATLANATTQDEITKVYSKLVTTANTKLKNKPVEKKETPEVDTTNGQPTVGKKAENTEKKSDSNSIENTGSNDPRNGKALDRNNAFRAETTETQGNFTYSMEYSNGKEIYLYNEEDADVNITVNSTAGKIKRATIKAGSGQFTLKSKSDQAIAYAKGQSSTKPEEEEVERDDYGWSYHQIITETQGPVTIKITGKPNDTFKGLAPYTKTEDQRAVLGARYLELEDSTGAKLPGGRTPSSPGYFNLVVKSQTYKYDIQPVEEANKVAVADINNLTPTDINKIKEKIKIQYSDKATREDARLASKQGEVLADRSTVVKEVAVANGTVTVTYNDDSVDTTPVASVARTNPAPTVELPYSKADKRQIYVYTGENTDLTFTGKDETTVKDLYLRGPGGVANDNTVAYGFTTGKIDNGAVTNGEGTVAADKRTATIKMTGVTTLKAPNQWTSFIEAIDSDDAKSMTGADYNATTNDEERQQKPGYVQFVVKSQTDKYDIKAPTEKVTVADPANVTEDELTKIKEKLQLEYNQNNDDANISKDAQVTDKDAKIASVTKDDKGNLVVTYTDGSKDTRPLSDFVNKAPTVELPYSNADKRQIYVYTGENTDLTFTGKDEKTVKDLYLRGPGGVANDNAAAYGFTTGKIDNGAVTNGEGTVSADKRTATIKMTGVTTLKAPNQWTSFIEAKDNDDAKSMTGVNYDASTDDAVRQQKPGYVQFVVKSQTDKYDIKAPTEKVTVADPANVTEDDLAKIKEKLQLEYNQNNDDANISKDAQVTDKDAKIASVTKDADGNLVVTYTDGSKDTRPLSDFVNKAPTVELPYSNADKRQIYVYTGENTDLTFTGKDEKTVKDLYLRGPGGVANDNTVPYGFTTGKIDNGAVTNGEGTVSEDKRTATIKMTGVTTLKAPNQWTSFIVANDNDNAKSMPSDQTYDASTDDAVRQQKPGYVQFIVKNQTSKYDIAAPTEKVAVTDPANVTDAELEKIKEKLKLEYNKNNDDANLADKKGKNVDDKDAKIASVTKDADGNLVVTYTDGSKDTRPLSEFVTLDKQPAINEVNKAAEKQIDAINKTPNATDEEKQAAIDKVNADKKKALDEIAKPEVTTKDALDKAQTAGTGAIAKDNPVVAKKDEAKQAIDDALTAKNQAIDARTDLTPEEKTKAKEAAKAQADVAKGAVDAATTNAAVDAAKTEGAKAVENVTPVAKEEAKKAIAKALEDKNAEIDKRTDLTDEEKTAAKNEAKDKADAQLAKINEQPDAAATPTAAKTAQDAVDAAKKTGVDEVTAVNPEAVKKPAAKKAIDDALKAKEAAIDARPDLTDDEKKAAKDAAKDAADKAKKAIDAAPSNAAVDAAKKAGVDEVAAVNPEAVKKPAAKKAIDDALKAKEAAIDAREDLTPAEKDEAKKAAEKAADDAKKAIDAATTDAAVDAAKNAGTGEVAKVNPVAKEKAKEEIAKELAKKEEAIDARPDLTDEEKAKAKEEAQAKAKEATDAIDAQPANADTPEKAAEAQKAVDGAKDKGVADVKAVNPEAVTKPAAKKAIDDALKAKEAAIDAREDLTPAEKDEAKKAAEKAADDAKKAIDAATTDAAVDAAKNAGTGEVAKVNPVAKEKAKEEIAKELAKKEEAIDARPDLTDEEKAAAKKEAQDKAKEATEAIDAQPSNADTPEKAAEAQKAVDGAKDKGVADVKAVNPEAVTKPAAKKAIDDKLAKQLEDIANTPDATDEEKKVAADAAKDLADQAKKEIDNAKKDADVKGVQDGAEKEIEKSVPVVEDKPNARKAIEDEAKAKKAEIDARTDLTPKAKEALKARADKVAEKAKEAIDAVSSVDDVNTIEEADKAAIKAIGEVNRPIDKVLVKDPSALTDEEKAKILEEVKKVNPTAKEVKYDENGNIEVTTEAGDKGIIDPTKLVKTEDQLDNGKGGNDINKPLDKVIVKDPSKLTDEEKAKIVAKVEEVNPDAIVTIDEDGTVSVSTPDGKTAAIPASELVRTKEDTAKPDAGNSKIVKPADKIVGEANDPDDQAKAEEKLRELNPETKSVKFDEDGNATVTLKDGTTATIPSEDLFKSEVDATKPNAGNDIVKPADKAVVQDPAKLTDAEKKAIEDKVKAVNPDATVVVDDKGNATVTTPEGKTAVIPAADLTKSPEEAAKPNAGNDIVKPAAKTVVANPDALTPEEKKAIEDKVKAVNPDATVAVDDKGNATVTTPEGKTAVIPAADLTKSPEEAAKPEAGNNVNTPADKAVVKDPANLTPEEKKAIEDKVKAVNPDATVVVDDKGNATVTPKDGEPAVIPAADLTKSPEEAAKPEAGNNVNKPADKAVVKDPANLTPEEKKAIEDKVKAVNPDATVVVDDKGNATVTPKDGEPVVIPAADLTKSPEEAAKPNAGDDIVKPAAKTVVANPDALTPEEKKAIEDKVKAVNPDATVAVDDKGNATVTTPEGKTAVIPAADLTKSPEEAAKPEAGNNVNKPADKAVVKDPANLTPEEKKAIEDKVKAVNPDATVVVDDKGNATVTPKDGEPAVIPAADLTKSPEEAAKPEAGNNVNKPADKAVVKDPTNLTPEEKKAIEDKVKAVNPDATVVVDDKGNATVTPKDGEPAVIPAADLTKSPEEAAKPNAGDDIVKPAAKTVVANPDALTPEEKKAIEDKVKAVNPDATVAVDDKGNATVTTPEGKTAVIPAADLTKSPEEAAKPEAGNNVNTPADKAVVKDPANLTSEEKKAIEDKVKAVNPDATVVVDDKGNATVTPKDGEPAVIPAADLTKSPEEAAKPEAGNNVNKPADKAVVKDPANLTPEEKKAIEDKVKAVNPDATVVVDDKGNATVTPKDGEPVVIPAADLTKSPEEAAKPNAGDDIVKPAAKTVVANPDALTPEEKKAIEDKVKAVNPGATVAVDDKGNATVTTPEGKTAVIPAADLTKSPEEAAKPEAGNNVNTPADKAVVKDPANLTPEEKKAIEDKVKAVNPDATVVVDEKGNATVTPKDGEPVVIPAADLTKSPEEAAKPEAGNNVNKPADKAVVKNPANLTPEEKKAIEDKVKAVNPGATVVVDEKGNATVTTPEGNTAVIPAADLTKSPEEAAKPNAGNDIVKPAAKTEVKDPAKLTDAEKKAIEDKVKAVNPGATVVVDEKGNATVTTPEGNTAVIPAADLTKSPEEAAKPEAGNNVNTPADKAVVKDPANLTPEEKKAIEDKVKAVNPGATVVVDDKGNATVTTPEGKTAVIPAADLTKSPEEAAKPNAGNDIVKPAAKTEVKDPAKLTDAEKKAIEDKVKAVNPEAKVVVDDKGNATVTTPEGKTAVIPAADLTKSPEEAAKPEAGNTVNTPADKAVVKDPANLTPEEKKAIEDKVKAVNPGATVAVDDKGNATVTTPEGNTAVIPAADLTKSPEEAAKPEAGNNVNKPADKAVVKDPANLTPEEKKAIEDKVKAVNPGATVVVDEKGNATVTTPEGKTAVIPAADLTKSPEEAAKPNAGNDIVKPAAKTEVKDPAKLTDAEKKAIEDKVKAVNPGATVVVDEKGNVTVTTPEGKTAVIPAADLTKSPEEAGKDNAGNAVNTPAANVEVKDPAKLTDEEKAKVKEAIESVNPGSKVVVDDKGNATVTTPEGDVVVIPAADLTKSPEEAGKDNAGNAVNTPAAKIEVKDPAKLTDAEKKAIEDKVKAVNPGSKVVVDDKGNATVTTPEGTTATIPAADVTKSAADAGKDNAGNAVNTPAAKTVVKDPAKLTDAEKKAIEDKVKAVNPGSKVVVDDKGNATVTTPEGKTATIPAADLTKSAADTGKENAGNGANTPATKTVVKDPAKLTDEEKAKVKKAVEDVNPGSTVVVTDKGDVIVTKGDGTVLVIPELDLVIPEDKLTDPTQQNGVNTPATRVLVGDKAKLTADEIEKVKESIKAVNPGATVVVDENGNATVTTEDGKTATIPAAQLVKDAKDVAAKNNGENINVDFEKETVADFNNLTDAEKEAAKAKIKGANADVVEVIFDKAGNATVITKDGKVYTIVAKDIFRQKEVPTLPGKVGVENAAKLTDAEKEAVKQALIAANPKLKDAKITIADNGEATIVYPDGQVVVIPANNLVTAKGSNGQGTNAKLGQRLANTGTTETNTGLAGLGLGILGGLLAAARRRKNDEN